MLRRAIFGSFGVAVLMMSGLIGGAYAVFSDTETAADNQITTGGSPDIRLSNDGTTFGPNGQGVSGTWTMSDMTPGVSTTSATLYVRNSGDSPATRVGIEVSSTTSDPTAEDNDTLDGAEGMEKFLEVTSLDWDGGGSDFKNLLYQADGSSPGPDKDGPDVAGTDQDDPATVWNEFDDLNGNGWIDLDDLAQGPITQLRPAPDDGETITLDMGLKFRSDATNDYQGDEVTMTMNVTLFD